MAGTGGAARAVGVASARRSSMRLRRRCGTRRRALTRAVQTRQQKGRGRGRLIVFNVSGLHPGGGDRAVYEEETGWRVDAPLGAVVSSRLQRLRRERWARLPVQGAFLRMPGLRLQAMDWRKCGAEEAKSRHFSSKLLRETLPTGVDRGVYSPEAAVRCAVCEHGWAPADRRAGTWRRWFRRREGWASGRRRS